MKIIRLLSLWTALGALIPPGALAAAGAPDYYDATTIALQHANSPTGWVPTDGSIVTITGIKATEDPRYGITYAVSDTVTPANNRIIVRSLAYASRYSNVGSYTTYGDPWKNASWMTTGNDATRFLDAKGGTAANLTTLMERGLGMQDSGVHDAIVEYDIAPNNNILMRPDKHPDISTFSLVAAQHGTSAAFLKPDSMTDVVFSTFQTYYNKWVQDTVVVRSSTFPFTQLGYTFFWGNGYTLPQIQGMSEFIIPGGTAVDIYGIYSPQSYIYTRNDGSVFSSAAGSQYGNGFASFDVTGTCDSIWAGHRFQKKTLTATDPGTPNKIIVENTGSVSGGSGILVWSLNYDVTNNGSITGATTNKFNINGTSNIGILFQGDNSATYAGAPTGINKLTNNGTISSPGTAVKAAAGNTTIINNAGGTISGGTYAILTGAGNDAVTLHGGLVSGRIDLGGGTNSLTVDGTTQLGFTLDPNTKGTAQVANPGTVNISNDKLTLSPSVTGNVVNGDAFLIVDATALTADTSKITVQNDPSHPMLAFTLGKAGNQLSLTATRDNSFYSSGSGNSSLGTVLDSLASSPSGDMAAVLAALDGSGGAANARQLQPGVDNGALAAAQQTQGQFLGTVMGHLEGLGSGAAPASVAGAGKAGAGELDPAVWSQGLGTYMHQSPRGQSNGYAASLFGWSGGYDTEVRQGLVLGLGAGYAHDLVRSADSGGRSDVASYQGSAYGGLTSDAGYLDGLLSIAHNRYDSSRHITFGGLDRTAQSSYNGRQYTGYAEGGFFRETYGMKLTPLASLQYTHLRTDAYSETGAGAADLSVDAQDYDLLESGLGFKLAYPVRARLGDLSPDFHARWLYDLVAQSQQATASFAGGGPSFSTSGFTPARSSFDLGAKLALTLKQTPQRALTVALNYDLLLKTDFYSHSGSVNLRYSF